MSVTIPNLGGYTAEPLNSNWNLGEDGSTIAVVDSNGNAYNFGKTLDFHATFKHEDVQIRVLNYGGRELTQTERYGGTLEFTIARENGDIEALEYLQQQLKRAGQAELYFTVTQFVNNPDGSSDENTFINTRLKLSDSGTYKIGSAVELKVQGIFEDYIQN